jgi:HlyD family secretion protein
MKRVIVALCLILVLAVAVWVQRSRHAAEPVSGDLRTAQVTRGTLTVSVTDSGTLQPYASVEVRSRSTGTVVDLRVQAGDRVTRGELLAVIDDKDARANYQTAMATLASAQAKLNSARRTLDATRAQDTTKITQAEAALRTSQAQLTQVLAGSRPEEIAQAREALQQAQAASTLAKQTLDRNQALYDGGLIARQDLDQAQSQYQTAQAQVRAAQEKLKELQAGNTPEAIAVARAQVSEAQTALASARAARLQEDAVAADVRAAEAQVQSSQGDVDQARDHLSESQVVAPIDGIVATLAVQVGQSVIGGVSSGGTLVMTIADTRVMEANIQVDETDIAQVRIGMPVRVTVDALPDRVFTGKVVRIAPQATVTQNVTQFDVIVDIDDPDRLLRLGMSADGQFIVAERQNALLVPVDAVRGKDSKVVVLVKGQTLGPAVAVETGITDGRQIEIVKGLQEGQTVLLGSAPVPAGNQQRQQQPVNPFQPQFQRRGGGR